MDCAGNYGFVGNIEGYHGLGNRRVQHDLSGLGCLKETVVKQKERKGFERN
jgi:xylose isomerase